MKDGKVVAAYCVPPIAEGIVHQPFVASLMNVVSYESAHGQHLESVIPVAHAYIPQGRTDAVKMFLETDAEWLWFLDYDMVFEPDALERLLSATAPPALVIVSALYFNTFADGKQYPVWLEDDPEHIIVNVRRISDELAPYASVGMGCTLIHRQVLEDLALTQMGWDRKLGRDVPDPWPWFGHDIIGSPEAGYQRAGEDVTFCLRARALGYTVWGYTGVVCEHIKSHRVTMETAGKLVPHSEQPRAPELVEP